MSQKTWLGRIYIREEGGYEIILRSLNHYKKRLKTIGSSPQLKDAPMFVQIVQQEAAKTVSIIDKIINNIQEGLKNPELLNELQNNIEFIEKALSCYQTDIQNAQQGDAFYVKILADNTTATSDLDSINKALEKIKQFC